MHPLDIQWIYTLGSVVLVSCASFLGMIALSLSPKRLSKVIPPLLSLAAGALLGTALGHLLPESIEQVGSGRKLSILLLVGFVIFFAIEKALVVWNSRSSGNGDFHHHHHQPGLHSPEEEIRRDHGPVITNLLLGAAIHSSIDGMAMASAYCVNTHLGIITTIAVLIHEAPHHIGDVSVLIHKGIPVMRAVLLSLLASAASVIGALAVLFVGTQTVGLTTILLPVTTANFLYIAACSLMPELQHERGLRQSLAQLIFFVAGCSLVFLSKGE
ncbi:MAG TPA: ZIP family metal transporter [Bryobacteraceae bacterium]|jgi:zinc and cadmium transporter